MEYKEFIDQVKVDLPERLFGTLEGATVKGAQVNKLQGLSYTGISIVPEGSIMGLTMDMQSYFQLLDGGMDYERVVERIADTAVAAYAERPAFTAKFIESYEAVKDRLMIQLIGREGNEEILQTIPHHPMEDMEIVYRLHVQDTVVGRSTVLVTNAMLEQYGITAEQLQQDALVSVISHEPYEIKTIAEIINELVGAEVVPKEELPVYVASNKERMNGAGVITYPGFMEDAAKQLGGDFYILPSSLHEVILVPDTFAMSYRERQDMVKTINAEQVDPENKLSDHVYHYDCKEKIFERADKYESRKLNQELNIGSSRASVLETLRSNQKDFSERSHKNSVAPRRDETVL